MQNKRKMIGTVEFMYGATCVDVSPVYEGEDPQGNEVRERGRRAVEMLSRDRIAYFNHSTPVFREVNKK